MEVNEAVGLEDVSRRVLELAVGAEDGSLAATGVLDVSAGDPSCATMRQETKKKIRNIISCRKVMASYCQTR